MFLDAFYPPLKKNKIFKSDTDDSVRVNRTGYVYGFKYSTDKDVKIFGQEILKLFSKSDIEEMSVMFVKSHTQSDFDLSGGPISRSTDRNELPEKIIDFYNSKLSESEFQNKYSYETIFICSNNKINSEIICSFISLFDDKEIHLEAVSSSKLLDEIKTYIEVDSDTLKYQRGSFNESGLLTKKKKFISSPLIKISSLPSTSLLDQVTFSNLGYKLFTCLYLFKVDGEVLSKSFHGLRLYSDLYSGEDIYKSINNLISLLSVNNIKYHIPEDSLGIYQVLIPGVIHSRGLLLKISIKTFDDYLPTSIIIRENITDNWSFEVNSPDKYENKGYTIQSKSQVLGRLNTDNKLSILCGARDDSYKSFLIQEIINSCTKGDYVFIIDMQDDLDYLPILLNGSSCNNPRDYSSIILSSILNNRSEINDIDGGMCEIDELLKIISDKSDFSDYRHGDIKIPANIYLLKPIRDIDISLFYFFILAFSKHENIKVVINNAEDVIDNQFSLFFFEKMKELKISCLTCFGSNRLFEKNQILLSNLCDFHISRNEKSIKLSDVKYEVSELGLEDEMCRSWFNIRFGTLNTIALVPIIKDNSALINTSKQTYNMVVRLFESGTKPVSIYDKLRAF